MIKKRNFQTRIRNVESVETVPGTDSHVVGPDCALRLIQVCWELDKQDKTTRREMDALLEGMQELELHESWIVTAYEEDEYMDAVTGRLIHIVPAYKWLLQ